MFKICGEICYVLCPIGKLARSFNLILYNFSNWAEKVIPRKMSVLHCIKFRLSNLNDHVKNYYFYLKYACLITEFLSFNSLLPNHFICTFILHTYRPLIIPHYHKIYHIYARSVG